MPQSNVKRLAIIPVRSGSKGLPNKNILPLAGKPLIHWTIEAALASGVFSEVFVSTDSQLYAEIAEQAGVSVPILRPEHLATDQASTIDVVLDVLNYFSARGKKFDEVAVLQATSPLRTAQDIQQAVSLMTEREAPSVISVAPAEHPPFWTQPLAEDLCIASFAEAIRDQPRQALGKFYRLNGAIYLAKVECLIQQRTFLTPKTIAFIMPAEHSVDIDSALDFHFAESIFAYQNREK